MSNVMANYRRAPTNNIYPAGLNYLTDLIARPGIEKTFGPLLLYRGNMNRSHAHRFWNMALLMMAHEAETLADGLKILNDGKFAQLCGPYRKPPKSTLWSFFGRLLDSPYVMRNITGFADYVRSLELGGCTLERVDRYSTEPRCAEWRRTLHDEPGRGRVRPERSIPQRFYPFLAHEPKEAANKPDGAAALVRYVNNVVSSELPEQVRADACQDCILALLTGDTTLGNLESYAHKAISKAWKETGWVYNEAGVAISMDQPIACTDGEMPYAERV